MGEGISAGLLGAVGGTEGLEGDRGYWGAPPRSHPRLSQALGSRGHVCAEVESQTRRRVQAMQGGQAQGKERVLRQLLGLVCAPHPQLHPNYRPGA
ncbi:V-type proton ATPase subunit G 2 [Chelonoidis abingdonii]|uniref:V-type proton ATPase subunit G 2 n=1 Tax=Chelonoidis abingdonii TaxID=106734 RepID=UPI0013F2A722|nr:V-type proton ATPase subunit G 2 [Chelonoidis abingdonii]